MKTTSLTKNFSLNYKDMKHISFLPNIINAYCGHWTHDEVKAHGLRRVCFCTGGTEARSHLLRCVHLITFVVVQPHLRGSYVMEIPLFK